jgi:hypothetical protein
LQNTMEFRSVIWAEQKRIIWIWKVANRLSVRLSLFKFVLFFQDCFSAQIDKITDLICIHFRNILQTLAKSSILVQRIVSLRTCYLHWAVMGQSQ